MLRFLSNYLFQNENQPENDPTTISSNSEQQGPKCTDDDRNGEAGGGDTCNAKDEFMDFMEASRAGDSDEEDDWVLIGEGENRAKGKAAGDVETVQEQQPVSLVAAPSEGHDAPQGCDKQEDDSEEEDDDADEEDDEEEDQLQGQHLLWENKLIEHPSMSVYVDLATSMSSTGVTSCVSLSSIAPATSPGESVIVIEGHEDDSDDSDDEDMDILEVTQPLVKAPLLDSSVAQEDSVSDMENNNNFVKSKSSPTAGPSAPLQNGRRKKGHYPCSSSNSNMPRRAHLRSSGGNSRNNQTFQMISSNSWTSSPPLSGQSPDAMHESMKRKRSNNAPTAATTAGSASACGIAMVGGTGSPNPATANLINKNLKLVDMFPTAAPSAKRRQRHTPPQNGCTQPKGHFLQESRRRQDVQNCTKRSFVNNDRRSAQQRRVQKGAGAGAAGARSK